MVVGGGRFILGSGKWWLVILGCSEWWWVYFGWWWMVVSGGMVLLTVEFLFPVFFLQVTQYVSIVSI